MESAAYCNQTLLVPYDKNVGLLNHSVIVITFMLAQSDPIKRRTLYLNYINVSHIWIGGLWKLEESFFLIDPTNRILDRF